MKTSSLKQKLAGLLTRLSLVTAISLFSLSCTAQSVWEAPEVKTEKTVFICEDYDSHVFIRNSNYIDPMKTRIQYNWDALDFSYVSLISHDPFLEAFKEAFTANRLTQLAAANDLIYITFNVDEKGQILGMRFRLREGTTILPEELERLERELLSRVRFVVIGKKIDADGYATSSILANNY